MSEEFLDWAVRQEEGLIISAGFDPEAKRWSDEDESQRASAAETTRPHGPNKAITEKGSPKCKKPVIATDP